MQANAVLINSRDNVAVAIREVKAGVPLSGIPGVEVKADEDIMRNHKVALAKIEENAPVIKYGEAIGLASKPIRPGEWVHTHNLKSKED